MGRHFLKAVLFTTLFSHNTIGMQKPSTKITTFKKHQDTVQEIKIFDNDRVLSLSKKALLLWDAQQRQSKNTLVGRMKEKEILRDVEKFDDEKILSVSDEGVIKLWDMQQQQCIHEFENNEAYSRPDNIKKLNGTTVLLHKAGRFGLWDVETGKFTTEFGRKCDYGSIESKKNFCMLNQNNLVSSFCTTLYLWDAKQKKRIHSFYGYEDPGHCGDIEGIYKFDENRFLAFDTCKEIKLWDTQEKKCMQTLSGHKNYIKKVVPLNKNTIASISATELIIWETATGNGWYLYESKNYDLKTIEKNNDKKIVTGHRDGSIKIWNLGNGPIEELNPNKIIEAEEKVHNSAIKNICVHPENIILSSCSKTNEIKLTHLS